MNTIRARVLLNELFHEYDAVKAHEYYLRTRELKGDQPGGPEDPESVRRAKEASAEAEKKKAAREQSREQLRQELEQKLTQLNARVDELNAAIKRAKFNAMRQAGNISEKELSRRISMEMKKPGSSQSAGSKDKASSGSGDSGSSGDTPSDKKTYDKSAAQKRKDAKAAKEKYEKEKAVANPDEGVAQIQDKVDQTNQKLENLQKRLDAIARVAGKTDDSS